MRYAAALSVDPGAEGFSGEISIDLQLSRRTRLLWLHARRLDVDRAELSAGGAALPAEVRPGGKEHLGFQLPSAVGPGPARLTIRYRGAISSTDWAGLFRQQAGGAWYAYTHFEPIDARAVFPCFDEPALKVPWQLTLKVPRGLTAASNTPAESEADEGALRVVRFAPTRPLPSYLVAFAVGPFERVDAGRWGAARTPVQVLALAGRSGEAALAREVLGPALERLEAYFGTPYAYGKLDFVAVPIFFGAMENPGLITFNAEGLLVKPEAVTPSQRRYTTYVATHEMAHQWFGNLVTMAWWDDLWLNESFADWLADLVIREWHPDWERAVSRIASVRAAAMGADSLASAPRIRQPVTTDDELELAGGGASAILYSKGREVLAMAEGWLGPEKFQAGIRRHVAAHADGNATAADLFAALGAEAGLDVAPVLSSFIDQSGLPLVTAELRCEPGQPPALHLEQRRFLRLGQPQVDDRRWKIPLCARYPAGPSAARTCTVLDRASADLPLPEAKGCPPWVVPNDGVLSYFRLALGPRLRAQLLGGSGAPLTPAERAGLLADLYALVRSGDVPMADALAQVPEAAARGDRHVVSLTVHFLHDVRDSLFDGALRPRYVKMMRQLFGPRARALGLRPRPGDDEGSRLMRPDVVDAAARLGDDPALGQEARKLAGAWMADHAAVGADMAPQVLSLAARNGDVPFYEQIAAEALRTTVARERRILLGALGSFRSPELVRRNLDLLLGGRVDAREALGPLLFGALDEPAGRQLAYDFMKAHWDELAARVPQSAVDSFFAAGAAFCDAEHRRDVEESFGPRAAKLPQGAQALERVLSGIDHCLALRERQQASATAFIDRY